MTGRAIPVLAVFALLALGCTTAIPLPSLVPVGSGGPSSIPASDSPSETPATVSIGPTPACALLYKADVASALGTQINEAQDLGMNSDETGWMSECMFYRLTILEQAPLDLTVASGAAVRDRFEEVRSEADVSSVDGVGDEAALRVSTIWGLDQPISALFVRSGGTFIALSLGIVDISDDGSLLLPGNADDQRVMLVDLASLVLGRLTGPPPEASKICELLPIDEAASLVGAQLTLAKDVDEHEQWDPSCRYEGTQSLGAGKFIELFLSVKDGAAGLAIFDACKQTGAAVLGVGEEAFRANNDCGFKLATNEFFTPLLVRSGSTVITVGLRDIGPLSADQRPIEVARRVLAGLGLGPGTTPAPVASDLLAHACNAVSTTEVGAILGEPITSTYERDAAQFVGISACEYHSGDGRYIPLWVKLVAGDYAMAVWTRDRRTNQDREVLLAGIGDEAYSLEFEANEDQPALVNIYVRSGNAVLELDMGVSKQSADYLTYLAPGTPGEQLEMLRQLADLILPRLFTEPG